MHLSRALARFVGAALTVLALAGCATFSPDGGTGVVQSLARERLGANVTLPAKNADNAQVAAAVADLLSQALTPDSAMQVALLDNPGIRASLAELGVAEADLVQAGRLANPRFDFGNKRSSEAVSIDRTILFNVLSLFARPLAQEVAARQFGTAQLQAAADVLQLARNTRRAWFSAVAAEESVKYFEQVKLAADTGAELATRMAKAGNFSKLTQMREQAFQADATARLAKARLAASLEREQLTRLLGITGSQLQFRLPERLPELPKVPVDSIDTERVALDRRLDVQIAKRRTEAMAANLGLTKATRFINVLELGYTNESNTGERRQNGYEIEVELPLFDWGDARLARAEAAYMQSVHRTADVALTARSEVRQRYQTYRTTYDVARQFRDEIVPLRKRIAEETLLRYNRMLIGVFELLADARDQIASVNASIEALRDFWLADTELEFALNGTSPGASLRTMAMPLGERDENH